jgi:putative porin
MRPPIRAVASTLVLLLAVAGRAGAETSPEQRLRVLEEQLRRTQEQLNELRQQVEQQKAISHATQKEVADNAAETKAAAEAQKKKLADLPSWLNRVTPFGDVRTRFEGFYHQPSVAGQDVTANNRERIRARLGVRFAYSDELSATIRGATGNINDPISTNETETGNFIRKNFNLDWAFITVTPGNTFGIRPGLASVTAGKFPNPIFRVGEMVFDEDLSLEGATQTFQLLAKPWDNLDQFKIHVLESTFDNAANSSDGWMFGGQLNPVMHIGSAQLEAGLGQFWWLNPDLIAQSLSKNTTSFTSSGAPVTNSNFNSSLVNTNLLVTKTIQPPTPPGGKKPAAFTAITGYQSAFNQTGLTAALTIPHLVFDQPLRPWVDFVYNWQAVQSAKNNGDDYGWQAGMRLGQTKVRGDWSVYGMYEHLGQEAAISSFVWSDFGNGGTNLEGPVVGIDYQLLDPLTLSARSYFTNFINRPAGESNPTQTRLQLDALVKF